jgi:hypothetical protein
MEHTQAPQPQGDAQLYDRAAVLLLQEKRSPQEVYDTLVESGVDAETANAIVGNIELQLDSAKKGRANKDMLYGALWCIGGIALTVADVGYIFWGAIVFGGIQFFRGVLNS